MSEVTSSVEKAEVITRPRNKLGEDEDMIELLTFERNIMLDTYADDVLFVFASGLGMERFILHHLHLYCDPQLLVFIINTTPQDDTYFLSRLRDSKVKCPPKIITADCSIKDRESLYMEGGIQFITSRILMVDLLQERVPVKNVAGIIVHRAHQLLSGFQESFILRLYRERKAGGFVKAFSDNPGALSGMGVLQRLLNRLYIRRVRLLPRFDVDVKSSLDPCSPHMIEITPDLPHAMRKIQSLLVDIIRTCVRELKQASLSADNIPDEESMQPASGLLPSSLEIQLKGRHFSITEKQQRLLADLKQLRNLLYKAEELDPITLYCSLDEVRNNKDLITTNSGWLFTQTASKLFAEADRLCKIKSDTKQSVLEPPKWKALLKILEEIKINYKMERMNSEKEPTVLLIGAENEVCRQLRDIVSWGVAKFLWIKNEQLGQKFINGKGEIEPEAQPSWDPLQIVLFANNSEGETGSEIINNLKVLQKEFTQRSRKRRRLFEDIKKKHDSGKQARLMRFGIVQIKKMTKEEESASTSNINVEDDQSGNPSDSEEVGIQNQDPLLVIVPSGDRYNLIKQLETFEPQIVILYHSDMVSLRLLEMYKACHSHIPLIIYIVMYGNSNEEERYLCSLRKEQIAFEEMVREQGTLMSAREYETDREESHRLILMRSTRDAGGRANQNEGNPKVIVDMREFQSELPTVLYKRGIDLLPATIEVGDYILSPNIAVERKALDDLTQSLHSGRIFKQIEQMLRHYKNVILLIEANVKDDYKKVNGGPFQGELSRRCRETRSLFTVLVRAYPAMNVIWTLDPAHSSEMFEELKLNEPDPDLIQALAVKSDLEECTDLPDSESGDKAVSRRLNSVLHRQMTRLPRISSGEVTRLMKCGKMKCLLDVVNSDVDELASVLSNKELSSSLHCFFNTDLKLKALMQ
ncbi:ERCC4 domain containing protein [Brugia malayi]|uniref:DNA repair endonuclease XPF n=1 Tax=Brugia malayi TaxID=6279 RepID=A8Q9D7_BRUMA|nr:ERCC4 domain containing protein [Brugia malayi]CRZ24176.1 BMA-XPF-1 [Brugia malayi]VIO94526.1 ERCC4 domain containing protein [Brugia malayi]